MEDILNKAREILKNNPSPRLEYLIKEAEKDEVRIGNLEDWLRKFELYEDLKKDLPELQKQQDEITTKISRNMEQSNDLRLELLV